MEERFEDRELPYREVEVLSVAGDRAPSRIEFDSWAVGLAARRRTVIRRVP